MFFDFTQQCLHQSYFGIFIPFKSPRINVDTQSFTLPFRILIYLLFYQLQKG